MVVERQYAVMEKRMLHLASQEDLSALGTYLLTMTNSAFRIASRLLSEKVLPQFAGEEFWRVFSYLSLLRPKAFLGTCLKASSKLYAENKIGFKGKALSAYASFLKENNMNVDVCKFLKASVVLLKEDSEFAELWKMFGISKAEERIDHLMHGTSPILYYEIFKESKRIQDSPDFFRKICNALIKKGDSLSFNLASIICAYYGINGVGALFSLKIEPYKLNYLEASQQNFVKVITSL